MGHEKTSGGLRKRKREGREGCRLVGWLRFRFCSGCSVGRFVLGWRRRLVLCWGSGFWFLGGGSSPPVSPFSLLCLGFGLFFRGCRAIIVVLGWVSDVLSSVFSRFSAFGFSGSRSGVSSSVLASVVGLVPAGSSVFLGCARGVDGFFRGAFPGASVFSASSFGVGRASFARRSAACVGAVAAAGGLWVSFPSSSCPAGLRPSASSSGAFCGSGSGSWASLALALGSGVPCLVFSPAGVPSGWGLSPVPGCPGWFGCAAALGVAPRQLSLF